MKGNSTFFYYNGSQWMFGSRVIDDYAASSSSEFSFNAFQENANLGYTEKKKICPYRTEYIEWKSGFSVSCGEIGIKITLKSEKMTIVFMPNHFRSSMMKIYSINI